MRSGVFKNNPSNKLLSVAFLKQELRKRLNSNSRYSMRAFAAHLGINVGTLSSLLSGKRALSVKAATQYMNRLGISPKEQRHILLKSKLTSSLTFVDETEIKQEMFEVISDWQHYGILSLIKTLKYKVTPLDKSNKWMAQALGLTELEIKMAVERLERIGLVKRNSRGYLVRTEKALTTADKNLTTAALKRHQKQVREKAIESLINDPIEIRSMTSMTMAIDPSKLEKARAIIDNFQNQLSRCLEVRNPTGVYQLCVSLFPMQKGLVHKTGEEP